MKYLLLAISTLSAAGAQPTLAQDQSQDILSILAQQAETPANPPPKTIPYAYTVTLDIRERDGKEVTEETAVLRIVPSQPPGSRAEIISASQPESEALLEILEDVEDAEKDMAEKADDFWCGHVELEPGFDPSEFEVLSETASDAVIRPSAGKLAELLMQSDDTANKKGRKMKKKLSERIEGEMILSKPNAEIQGFRVTMTRPLTMMVVAKLKVMDMEQNCSLAPNGFQYVSSFKMRVEGKAMGSRFGQDFDMRISDLTPLP